MHIVVFGANGKVGSLVVTQLLAGGHDVRAFIHGASSLPSHPHLTLMQGDIYSSTDVATAISGMDAVISALGSWGTPQKDILHVGMQHIIPAMHTHTITRIISLTGAEARATGDKRGIIHNLMHLFLSITAGKILTDGESHIAQLEASSLDWTVIRSPIMRDTGDSRAYTLGLKRPLPWQTIPRTAVATAMTEELQVNAWMKRAPFIS